jgi:hypothetical protein
MRPARSERLRQRCPDFIDDGRRWLNRHPDLRFDAIVQNTTWYYRPNVTNLLSKEYMELLAHHLHDGGITMYNNTGSARAQRTGCEVYASGFREINVMVVGNRTLRLDPERLHASLMAYRIDGRPLFGLTDPTIAPPSTRLSQSARRQLVMSVGRTAGRSKAAKASLPAPLGWR